MDNPALVTAWATVAIALVTGLGAAATCFLIWRGLVEMRRSSNERAKDRQEAREADLRRHNEALDEGLRRHEEAMTALKESMDQGLRRHDEAMTALQALIARSAPPGNLGQAD